MVMLGVAGVARDERILVQIVSVSGAGDTAIDVLVYWYARPG